VEHFTALSSLLGGALIGLGASILLLFNGRVAGISGILGGALSPAPGDTLWRLMFLLGLVSVGAVGVLIQPAAFSAGPTRSILAITLAGFLVGYGTRLGNGCTSGHGVCGVSRLSPRSLIATATFMATGALTVFIVQHVFGGAE
jgi:uncharacterized membrane protein YedE/YeeE